MNARESLVYELYACPLDPLRWAAVLDGVCRETGARSAVVQALRADKSGFRLERLEQDSHSLTLRTLLPATVSDESNPRLDMRRASRCVNRVVRDADLFAPGDESARHLHGWLGQAGLDRFVGCLWQVAQDSYIALALHRSVGDGEDFSADQLAWLSAFAPHLAQAFGLSARLQAGVELAATMKRLFDRLRCGIVLCGADGRMHWCNRSAEALLAGGTELQLHGARLKARRARDTCALLAAIGETAAADPRRGDRYIVLGDGPDSLHVAMQPFRTHEGEGSGYPATVLLAITALSRHGAVSPAAIVDLFGLTRAEAQLVAALVAGCTLEEYAQRRGISVGTVRGQVKQVFAKTGAARQSELVRLVLSSVAAQLVASADPA